MKFAIAAFAVLAATATMAQAAEDAPLLPRTEPYVPKAQRIPSREAPAAGAELRAQAMARLRERFDAADSDQSGTLTQQEAAKAGLGYVEKNFEEIDRAHNGAVTFADVQAFLRRRK
ncbi:EF-hand domain-containing protein [Pseudoduganella sp. OTU4001]|uniref:EF-hand domain-containing protein n=1 Tax=Pseudoduganella sp. OTU4001 TaxID=3043854 RepID=UPI00313AE5A3